MVSSMAKGSHEERAREIVEKWFEGILRGEGTFAQIRISESVYFALVNRITDALEASAAEARARALEEAGVVLANEVASSNAHYGAASLAIRRRDAQLALAKEALEFYASYIPPHRPISPESADFERNFGIGRVASQALAKLASARTDEANGRSQEEPPRE